MIKIKEKKINFLLVLLTFPLLLLIICECT